MKNKYSKIVENILYILNSCQVKTSSPEDDDIFQRIVSSELLFKFYWDTIDSIETPCGSIPFRSQSGFGDSFSIAKQRLIDHFGLVLVEEIDGMFAEKWFIYRPTQNIDI